MNKPAHVVWHRETLTAPTEDVLREFHDHNISKGAYLAGGTGLALRLGHRRSIDLDFFIRGTFDEDRLLQSIEQLPDFANVRRASQTLHLVVRGVKVSFLGHDYPLLFATDPFDGVPVADPRDIACMKISAVSSRGTKRDFVDLYAACKRFRLQDLLSLFAEKYARTKYDRLHILKSLVYFADAEKDPIPHMLVPFEWSDMKEFFQREVRQLQGK